MKRTPARIREAYHEAGHAVVGWLCGVEMEHAEIHVRDGVRSGFARPVYMGVELASQMPPSMRRAMLEGLLITFQAGRIAEEKRGVDLDPEPLRRLAWESSTDFPQALDCLARLAPVGPKRCRVYATLYFEAERIVAHHWRAIEAVAEGLLRKGRLDRFEIKDLILKAMPEGVEFRGLPATR